jgi:hypothetical protein
MKYGVVYSSYPQKLLNGTLFYGYEYCQMLRRYVDAKFYIVGVTPHELAIIHRVFGEKYTTSLDCIVPIERVTDLYALKLDQTVVLDVRTFYRYKEFFTNEVHCYSNEPHSMFRYKTDRTVTYYGSYDYQPHDVFSYLKLNFSIFHQYEPGGQGTFVSSVDPDVLRLWVASPTTEVPHPIYVKQPSSGSGDFYRNISHVHYVHSGRDKNNRIIPEAYWYKKGVSYERYTVLINDAHADSANLRFTDIASNGLLAYTLTENDAIISSCLK